jgi:hypothetical protein
MRFLYLLIALLSFWYIGDNSTLTTYESLSIGLFIFFFLDFLNGLGKKLVVFDLVILISILTCLIAPIIGYHVYNRTNPLAVIWVRYMFIPSDQYYAFMFPAVCAMIVGFRLPLGKAHVERNPHIYMQRLTQALQSKPNVGMILIGIGLVSGVFTKFMPDALKQFFLFLSHLIYVGVFYILYSPSKQKKKVVILVFLIMVGESIAIGMFGELIFTSAVSLILIMLGKKVAFPKKLGVALAGFYCILLLQSIKFEYRKVAWRGGDASPVYFAELLGDRITDPSHLVEERTSFLAFIRLNQGWLVGTTMWYVPKKFPFANGQTIWESVAAAFVPRFLWPNKPESGGKANLKRFWGYNLHGYSMNIGPFGEAYGNFGVTGGIIFMFFYGLFLNFVLKTMLKRANKVPTLILWVPFLFSGTLTVESDILTVFGVLIKGVFFIWLMFKIFKAWFHIEL